MRLRDQLDGRRILLTGVTGFVGEALLQRLLTDLPGAEPVVLVRPKAGQPGRERVAALLRKRTFAAAVERAGGVDQLLGRVDVLEGDLADVPELPDDRSTTSTSRRRTSVGTVGGPCRSGPSRTRSTGGPSGTPDSASPLGSRTTRGSRRCSRSSARPRSASTDGPVP